MQREVSRQPVCPILNGPGVCHPTASDIGHTYTQQREADCRTVDRKEAVTLQFGWRTARMRTLSV
jgi:hypothetical protein